jgi:putative ABC transport system permease protein
VRSATATIKLGLSSSLQSLRSHGLRSALTVLGIVIGVAAVITVMAVGAGSQRDIIERIQSLGGNLLLVLPGSARTEGARLGSGTRDTLTVADANAIRREITTAIFVAPSIYERAQVVRGHHNWATTVQGVTPDYLRAREWPVAVGRPITENDVRTGAKVVVLGASVAEQLFPMERPLGEIIRIDNIPFRVIGILAKKGQSSTGADQDDKAMMPLTTAASRVIGASRTRVDSVQYIMVKVGDARWLEPTATELRALLRQRHRLRPDQADDFTIRNLAEVQESREEAAGVLAFWLAAVASVSLIVGGISVMNIMLVSVSERTREIGLRLAVGARPRDIRNQFLTEAVVLSLVGGTIGFFLGVGLSLVIALIRDLPVLIQPRAILLAEVSAMAVGIFFGLYPALKAARMAPIDALRAE